MDYKVKIVRTLAELETLKLLEHSRLVADVETYGNDPKHGRLLGVALAPLEGRFADGSDAAYVVVNEYVYATTTWHQAPSYLTLLMPLLEALEANSLVGHNYCYDRNWLDHFGITTAWHADTRIMWHAGDSPLHSNKYALKEAQVTVLGWPERGDAELASQVEARGGSLKKGDHYLADTAVLGHYAGLDAISTAQLYNHFKPFFDLYDQWLLLDVRMRLAALLERNTRGGILCDEGKLRRETDKLKDALVQHRAEFLASAGPYVRKLEEGWKEDQAARYSPAAARWRDAFLANPSKHRKFKLSSDKDKTELFYSTVGMGLPVVETVKPRKDKKTGRKVYSKKPATGRNAVARAVGQSGRTDLEPVLRAYALYEHTETMLKNYASKWLEALHADSTGFRIHPPFNPCGTVTYRISGYAPYFLNPPFDEHALMSCFTCDPGFGGVHADLVSVEPAVTTHYSQDPSLLKVFRDGLGDVYLDLALTLFPKDVDLRAGYDPRIPCTSAIKERFKKQRKIAKVIQLAVQYTGTKYTVHASLTKAGWRGTLEEADDMVQAYWRHFVKVARMNDAMKALHAKKGYFRNAVGRVVRVPARAEKDVPNRIIQSSGHDILVLWALRIYELCKDRGIDVRPVLLDCHDSTSNQCPKDQVERLKQVYIDALADVNAQLRMTVPVKAEIKEFSTLAGLKGDDDSDTIGSEGSSQDGEEAA